MLGLKLVYVSKRGPCTNSELLSNGVLRNVNQNVIIFPQENVLENSAKMVVCFLIRSRCVNQDDGDISSRNHQQKSRHEFGGYFLQSSSCYIWYVLKRDLSIKDLDFVIFGRIMWTVGLTCLLDLPDNDESRKHMQSKYITSLSDSLKKIIAVSNRVTDHCVHRHVVIRCLLWMV